MRSRVMLMPMLLPSLFATACANTGEQPTAPVAAPRLERSSAASVHQLTGGGQIDLSAFDPNLFPETYAFSASVDADGRVRGQAEMRLSDPQVNLHAEVTCLAVAGSSAWVGGVVTQTSDADIVSEGTQFWTRVQDNGQGAKADPDRIGFIRLGAPAARCNEQRPVGMPFVFFRGDLQVR